MPRTTEELIGTLLERLQPKAKSLIVTVYGDAIAHHGGNAALGSVIELLRPLGLNERSVRTTMHRLAQEGWLQSVAFGRRSDYRLTETGRRRMDAAHGRIYRDVQRPWDRQWTIVAMAPAQLADEARDSLRRDLGWLGFGQLGDGVMLHPDPDEGALQALLAAQAPHLLVVRGPAARRAAGDAFEHVVRACWDLERLAADYTAFLDTFRPAWSALQRADQLDPEPAFVLRSLLMHALRRAILRDPMLPDELMPHGWPGAAAHTLSRNLYRLVEAAAERHVMSVLETAEGPVPDAEPTYFERFGGLRGTGSMPPDQAPAA